MNSPALNYPASDHAIDLDKIIEQLNSNDFVYLDANTVVDLLSTVAGSKIGRDQVFLDSWNSLEEDQYMADGGRYPLMEDSWADMHYMEITAYIEE